MTGWFRKFRLGLRSMFRTARMERELDEEFKYHLEREIEERIATGLTPQEARYAALRAMGAIEQSREQIAEEPWSVFKEGAKEIDDRAVL